MHQSLRAILLSTCSFGALCAASAQDDFDGYTNGDLSNSTADVTYNGGTGWSTGWYKSSGVASIISGGLLPITTTGHMLHLNAGSNAADRALTATYGSGAEAWISVHLRANVLSQVHHFYLFNGATEVFGLDSQGNSNGNWRLKGTVGGDVYGAAGPALDTAVHLLVLRIDGSTNTVKGWWDRTGDPGALLPDIPQISLNGSPAFNTTVFRVFGGSLDIDQVRVGSSYAEIAPPATVSLSASPLSISEDGGISTVVATLSAAAAVNVVATLAVSGTATGAGTDFTLGSSTITIVAGQLTGSTVLTAIQDDTEEPAETVTMTISGVTNSVAAATNAATVTIEDDDGSLTVPEPESESGSNQFARGAQQGSESGCGNGSLAGLISTALLMLISVRFRRTH